MKPAAIPRQRPPRHTAGRITRLREECEPTRVAIAESLAAEDREKVNR